MYNEWLSASSLESWVWSGDKNLKCLKSFYLLFRVSLMGGRIGAIKMFY